MLSSPLLSALYAGRSMINASRTTAMRLSSVAAAQGNVNMSIVKHPHVLNRADHVESSAGVVDQKNVFAVVRYAGKQYKVTKDDVFVTSTIANVDIGDKITIDDVLLVGSQFGTIVGRPLVQGAKVQVEVEELTRDKKTIALKFRRRKNSRRTRGFRRDVAVLRVVDIAPPSEHKDDLKIV